MSFCGYYYKKYFLTEPEQITQTNNETFEKKKFYFSLLFPFSFVIILWIIKIIENSLDLNLVNWGVYPLSVKGLKGIITAPLVHGSFKHLINNSVPLLLLGIALFYFYRGIAWKVFLLSYLLSGFWLWFAGRYAFHIGASGVVYGLASFLFFSGVVRKDARLSAISLIVVFLYGSMIWGIFPIKREISWEAHLMGAISGIVLAVYYKDYGPKKKMYLWEMEEEQNEEITEENHYEDNDINN